MPPSGWLACGSGHCGGFPGASERRHPTHILARPVLSKAQEDRFMHNPIARFRSESGRVGYLVLYLLGAPVGVLILLWVLAGNNIFSPG